jgi:hypothetical protein
VLFVTKAAPVKVLPPKLDCVHKVALGMFTVNLNKLLPSKLGVKAPCESWQSPKKDMALLNTPADEMLMLNVPLEPLP